MFTLFISLCKRRLLSAYRKSVLCFYILVLLTLTIHSYGQVSVKGVINDGVAGLPYATAQLLKVDSTFVKGTITNTEGHYSFEHISPGTYFIVATITGYTPSRSKVISVSDMNLLVPDITLAEASTQLGEIVISGDKPMFEQEIDRVVVNVQNSITSSGNTVLEVIQKSPGMMVNKQNNTIAMNGKTGVRVMLNGKMMQLPLDVVIQMLDGMSASNVEKLELINTPPSQFDAEGNGGIINIVTKENLKAGTSGSIGAMLGYRWAEQAGGNFNINHRRQNLALSLDYSVLRNHTRHLSTMSRRSLENGFIKSTDDYSPRENVTRQQNLSATIEWYATKSTTVNIGISGYRRNWDLNAVSTDINRVTADSTVVTDMKIYESNIWQSITAGLGIEHRFDTRNKLSLNVDYLYYHNDNPSNYSNSVNYQEDFINESSKIDLQKKTPIRFLIARVDYQYTPIPTLTFETGIKGVTSTLDNDVIVRRFLDDEWIDDPQLTSRSSLLEQVGAAYVSAKWQPAVKWQINSGLRYEYTHTAISTPTERNLINRKYGYLFPTFFVKRDIATERDVQFSYSRRITRPTYNDIAPFVFLWGPNTFSGGNTALLPAIADAVRIGYHAGAWIASMQFTHSGREINTFQPELDVPSNTLTYRSQNMDYLNTASITNSYAFSVQNWWEVQGTITAQYQVVKTSDAQRNSKIELYGVNLNVSSIFKLPHNFAFEISGFYQSTTLSGITKFSPMGSLNAGIQKTLGAHGTLRLAMDDILYTNYWRIKANSPENNVDTYFKYDFHNQYVRLTYSRNLGNGKLKAVKLKSGADEERSRVN